MRELQECLQSLGLKTTGVKSQLVERLTGYLAAERQAGRLQPYRSAVATIVELSNRMQGLRVAESVALTVGGSGPVNCICRRETMNAAESRTIECVTPQCGRHEHMYCLFPARNIPNWAQSDHRCLRCRMYFADPFWTNVRNCDILPPTLITEMLQRPYYQQTGSSSYKVMIKEFTLLPADLHQLRTSCAKIQVMCMQLDDPVQFRFHWPVNCKLTVNGKDFRVYPRHADNKITEGQRDEPADISKLVVLERNRVEISCQDDSQYVFCIQLVNPVSEEAVLRLMHDPENLDAATMRMRRIVRGQVTNDYDDEIQTMTSMMSLRCPFSSKRIKNPARLLNIDSLECVFDLEAFVTMARKTRKWACPHSLKQSSVHQLVKDVWLEAVLKCLQRLPDVVEIEVSKEGCWRLRGESKWRSVYNTSVIEEAPDGFVIEEKESKAQCTMDEESEDEAEELRKAALAAKQAFKKHYQEAAQNQHLEVVNLLSSDEDAEMHVHSNAQTVPSSVGPQWRPRYKSPATGAMRRDYPPARPLVVTHRPNPHVTSMGLARHVGYDRSEVPVSLHNVLPPRLGTGYGNIRPAHPASYPPPGYFHGNYTVAPVQMHPNDGAIFVKNTSISIPSEGIPKPGKRSAEFLEPRSSGRKTERKRQFRKRAFTDRAPVLPMECIEIDQDSE